MIKYRNQIYLTLLDLTIDDELQLHISNVCITAQKKTYSDNENKKIARFQ